MKPSLRDTADTSDMNYEITELLDTNKGFKMEVIGTPKDSKATRRTSTAPVFYDSSNDENLFFTLPDLNFDSNSEEDGMSVTEMENTVGGDDAHGITLSPVKSEIDFTPNVVDGSSSSDIKNFSVMKRYLKKEKENNIIIELNEVDEAGVVVKTQIVQADEFSVTTSTHDKSKAVVENIDM